MLLSPPRVLEHSGKGNVEKQSVSLKISVARYSSELGVRR